VVLRNCGVIDPENIYEYVARDGYEALARVLTDMTPKDVIDTISRQVSEGAGEQVSLQASNGNSRSGLVLTRNM